MHGWNLGMHVSNFSGAGEAREVSRDSEVEQVLADPDWFLFRLLPAEQGFLFVKSNREILTGAIFLDGREPVSASLETVVIPVDVAAAHGGTVAPFRIVSHAAFCRWHSYGTWTGFMKCLT